MHRPSHPTLSPQGLPQSRGRSGAAGAGSGVGLPPQPGPIATISPKAARTNVVLRSDFIAIPVTLREYMHQSGGRPSGSQ